MKRLVTFTLSLILVLVATVPAFAAPVDDEGNVAFPVDENGVPTVNISEESVEAIANAVTYNTRPMYCNYLAFETDSKVFYLPSWFVSEYPYFVVTFSSGWRVHGYSSLPTQASDGYYYADVNYQAGRNMSGILENTVLTDLSFKFFNPYRIQQGDETYSNFDMYRGSTKFPANIGGYAEPKVYVSFDTGFDDYSISGREFNDSFTLPDAKYPGYTFLGWYIDESFESEFYPGYSSLIDFTLYAKWSKIPIIYYDCGYEDMVVEPQLLTELRPPQLERPGIIFAGWFQDPECMYIFDPMQMDITEDITVYAKWLEAPDMFIFHDTIFDSLQAFLNCEPVTYILVLMSIILLIGIGKVLICTRL